MLLQAQRKTIVAPKFARERSCWAPVPAGNARTKDKLQELTKCLDSRYAIMEYYGEELKAIEEDIVDVPRK